MTNSLSRYVLDHPRALLLAAGLALLVTVGAAGDVAAQASVATPPTCNDLLPGGLPVDCDY